MEARWRHGAEWTVRVRYRRLNYDGHDGEHRRWRELFVSSDATSTVIDSLAPARQYLIVVDARNEVGYNSSLTPEPIIISDAETSKCILSSSLLLYTCEILHSYILLVSPLICIYLPSIILSK